MKKFTILGALALVLLFSGVAGAATSYSTDLEGFSLGSFVGQGGWLGNGSSGTTGDLGSELDEEILEINGNKVFRISNAVTSGNYAQTHPTLPPIDQAGESSLSNTNYDTFSFSFDFMSASTTVQEGLSVGMTPFDYNTASRQGIVRISDSSQGGFSVGWWEVLEDGSSFDFNFVSLGDNLDRDTWYHIEGEMTFNDGALNDTVKLFFGEKDGTASESNLTTWERYYETVGGVQPSLAPVDSLIMRVSGTPVDGVFGGGVYFDNFEMSVSNSNAVPVPAAVWLLGSGLLGLLGLRRKTNR